MVDLVCLFMKMHLVALLRDNCLDLVYCAFLHKLSGCMRNITAFCQYLLRLIKLAVCFGRYRYIGKIQISADISVDLYLALFKDHKSHCSGLQNCDCRSLADNAGKLIKTPKIQKVYFRKIAYFRI